MNNINATRCATNGITNKHINEAVEYKDPTEFGKGYAAPLVHNYSYFTTYAINMARIFTINMI